MSMRAFAVTSAVLGIVLYALALILFVSGANSSGWCALAAGFCAVTSSLALTRSTNSKTGRRRRP